MSTKYTCCASIHSNYKFYACGKTAKFERDGKHYCGTHDPVTRKAKDDAKSAATMAEWAAKNAARDAAKAKQTELERRAACFPELLEALQQFDALIKHNYSGSQEAMSDLTYAAQAAKSAIAKALGETT